VRRLGGEMSLPPLLARILAGRGLTEPGNVAQFLRPTLGQMNNPFELKGMEEAALRIGQAIQAHESIWIYGDYDVDGITATAVMLLTLEKLGCEADYYIPHRLSEGYGLNAEAVEQLAQEGAKLIVTVDCGITAVREAARARELGMDLIITDHHEPGPELPEVVSIINPKQEDCPYPFKGLSGAGVAFKLAHAILKRFYSDPDAAREFLKSLLDLVTLGTVADIVPLLGENRSMVAFGLERLRQSKRPGLMQLFDNATLSPGQINTGSISFVVAPRLNAAGRTEHAMFAVELLMTREAGRARDLARQLEGFNDNRRDIEQGTVEEALTLLEPCGADPVIVVAQEGWHQGVLGIVASRLVGQCYRPAIVFGVEGALARGSGRSIPGFDLLEALKHSRDYLLQFGGHKMAAGVELSAGNIDAFRKAINEYALGVMDEEMRRPLVMIDSEASSVDLVPEVIGRLEELAPYGPENPKPVVSLEQFRLIEEPRVFRQRHLKLICAGPDGKILQVIGWSMAGRVEELLQCHGPIRLAGTPLVNTYNGRVSIELELKDFQIIA
jgi:single-stranded-DNA-specific exonuclease